MLMQQDIRSSVTARHAFLPAPARTVEIVDVDQPVLALHVGSDLDVGLERKDKPNEDTIYDTYGVMTFASASPKAFALLMVADGMGGQAHGQEASHLAVQSLVTHVSAALCSKRMTPDAFLRLLIEGVEYA